jgi:branched-chain amino acid transport system substrate-binding protein
MSQTKKNETIVLFLAILISLGLVGVGAYWFIKPSDSNPQANSLSKEVSLEDRLSFGEKTLFTGEISPVKKAGIEAYAAKRYQESAANLAAALRLKKNDPEALIFLNNAKIGDKKSYTIAVSAPIGTNPNGALEMLRGVAQAQNEINASGGIKGIPLKVAITNDDNNPEIAKQIAETLVKSQEVLGVIGPYGSDVTLEAGKVYNSGQLVAISPVSTSVKLSGFSPYVFRTVPSDYVAARALADYMVTKLKRKNAAVFFNSQSNYSQSLKSEFVTAVSLGGGQVSSEFDFAESDFSAAKSIEQATKQGAEVLMLAPNKEMLDKALQVMRVNRKRLTLLGGDGVYTIKTLEVEGESGEGMVVAIPWHINGNSDSQFPRSSRQLWGADVNWRTALSYDATKAFIAALERNPSRSGVQQTLASGNFSTIGASGVLRFLKSGDRNGTVQLVKIVRGKRSLTADYDFVPLSE